MDMSKTLSLSSKSVTMAESVPRIALIGCGAIAEEYYLPALARHRSVSENLILVDLDEARTQKLAKSLNVKTCLTDYRQIQEYVDGVIIAVPTDLHYPITLEFLSRGIHVLCEKPLAQSAQKARKMVELARKNGAVLSVNYFQRLIPSFVKVKELLANRTLGEPLSIKYFVGEEFKWPTVSGFYFNSPYSSRGVLGDRGAHVFDHICWWLGGKPKLVLSQNDSFGGSDAAAYVQFEHGECKGEVKLSWLADFPCKFVIECEEGTIEGDVYDYTSLLLKPGSGRKERVHLKSRNKTKAHIAFEVVSNFIRVLSNGEEPVVSGDDVLESVQFIDECYAAATSFYMPWYEGLEVEFGS